MRIVSLNGEWEGTGYSPEGKEMKFSGIVPGCVHSDLLRAKIIEDPLYRDNADKCQWIDSWSWSYSRKFTVDELSDDAYLFFEGLDVYAEIYLNGKHIASTDDMHIPHKIPVGKYLTLGENSLYVAFISPTAKTYALPKRPAAFTCERLYTRRMQCTYFWDWVNRLITMGIFRDVSLVYPEKAAIDSIHVFTKSVDEYSAQLGMELYFDVHGTGTYAHYCLLDPDGNVVYNKKRLIVEDHIFESCDIASPKLWYPNGYGDQPLYTFALKVYEDDTYTRILDEKTINVGIRTIKLLQLPDQKGTAFYDKCLEIAKTPQVTSEEGKIFERNDPADYSGFIVVVNGIKIMVKGANWVPIEPFLSDVKEDKIEYILKLCKDTKMNMIRVWGGGSFEVDKFYDECDRLGFLVTQDMLMGCGTYPDDDPHFLELLKKEAEFCAKKVRSHACLTWFAGDNEAAMDKDEDMQNYPGRSAAHLASEPTLRIFAPNVPFLGSSPCYGKSYGSITKGTSHNTNFVGQMYDYLRNTDMADYREYYRGFINRFNVEEPAWGAPMLASCRKFMTDDDIFGDPMYIWRYHTKGIDPHDDYMTKYDNHDTLVDFSRKVLGAFKNGNDRLFKFQYAQYEMIRTSLERFRRNKWFSAGDMFWMLSDCWPASGWALVDYYGLPKSGYFSFKRGAKDIITTVDKENGEYVAYVCNDDLKAHSGKLKMFVWDFGMKKATAVYEKDFDVEENTTIAALKVPACEIEPKLGLKNVIICEISGDVTDRAFYYEERIADAEIPECCVKIVERSDNSVTVEADNFVQAVALEGEYDFEDNFFLMLPGERKTVRFNKAMLHSSDEIEVRWFGKL